MADSPDLTCAAMLAEAALSARITEQIRDPATRLPDHHVDVLGVSLAGSRTALARNCRAAVASPGEATVLGTDLKFSERDAAIANITSAHALDLDDVQQPWYGHPTAVLAPAALAVAESTGATAEAWSEAWLAGLIVGDALGAVVNTAHYDAGWHPTASLGAIATAAAISRLLNLSHEQTVNAIGAASTSGGGLRVHFGSDLKPIQAGLAGADGIRAARLAQHGVSAATDALEGPLGWADTHAAPLTPDRLSQSIPEAESQAASRIAHKRYPSCAATAPAVDAMLNLARATDVSPEAVERIHVTLDPLAMRLLRHHRPTSPQQAAFSIEYCLASALVNCTLGLRQFDPTAFTATGAADPAVARVIERVSFESDDSVVSDGSFPATVEVHLRDGRSLREHRPFAVGKPADPLSTTQLLAKFDETAGTAWRDSARQLLNLPALDLAAWTSQLRRAAVAAQSVEGDRAGQRNDPLGGQPLTCEPRGVEPDAASTRKEA